MARELGWKLGETLVGLAKSLSVTVAPAHAKELSHD
jgi:hypothetical protein